jgi:hypothetical protein
VLRAARDAGATHAGSVMLRLPGAVATIFAERLTRALPLRAKKVLARVREGRGGQAVRRPLRRAPARARPLRRGHARAVRGRVQEARPPLRRRLRSPRRHVSQAQPAGQPAGAVLYVAVRYLAGGGYPSVPYGKCAGNLWPSSYFPVRNEVPRPRPRRPSLLIGIFGLEVVLDQFPRAFVARVAERDHDRALDLLVGLVLRHFEQLLEHVGREGRRLLRLRLDVARRLQAGLGRFRRRGRIEPRLRCDRRLRRPRRSARAPGELRG